MKKIILSLMLIFGALLAEAQDDQVAYHFDYANTKATGTKFIQNDLTLRLPIKTGKKSHFIIGLQLGILNISHSLTPADSASLKTIGVIFGYQTIVGTKNRLSVTAEPLIASDFGHLQGNDFRFKSDAAILLNTEKKLAFGFGLVYQYQFSGSQLLPIVTTVWRISDKVTLAGALPIFPRLEVKLDQHWTVGGGVNLNYNTFRLNNFDNQYVQVQNLNFGFNAKYRTASRIEFGTFLGFGSRTVSVYNADQTIPLRIYSLDIGGGSHTPYLQERFKGPAINFTLAYKIDQRKDFMDRR